MNAGLNNGFTVFKLQPFILVELRGKDQTAAQITLFTAVGEKGNFIEVFGKVRPDCISFTPVRRCF